MSFGAGPAATAAAGAAKRNERQKIGHRRVDDEGQVTYKKRPTNEIMLAIQLGIQNSVGNETQKPNRDLLTQDFGVVEIVDFPREGGKFTVAHSMTSFTFKTYAPLAFRHFRKLYNIDISQFLASICGEELEELSNPGASGSIFYRTADDNFIIKTVQHKEAKYLQRLLLQYYLTLTQNPRTLLPKFYGLYCYQSGSKNIRFVVMNNLLPSTIKMTEKYDLKGSTYKRQAGSSEREKSVPTFKDLDFKNLHEHGVSLEADIYSSLIECISRDCLVLESFRIMDYSLLLGIYNLDQTLRERQEAAGARRAAASAASASAASSSAASAAAEQRTSPAQVVGVAAESRRSPAPPPASSDARDEGDGIKPLAKIEPRGLQRGFSLKKISVFNTPIESINAENANPVELQSNEVEITPAGGIPARNHRGDRLFLYMGIIDILQNYRLFKKMEHAMKSIITDGDTVSVHNPRFYSERFQLFLTAEVFRKIDNPPAPKPPPARRKPRTRASTMDGDTLRPASHSAAAAGAAAGAASAASAAHTADVDTAPSSAPQSMLVVHQEQQHHMQQQQHENASEEHNKSAPVLSQSHSLGDASASTGPYMTTCL